MIIYYQVQLMLEQYGFELPGVTYIQVVFQ